MGFLQGFKRMLGFGQQSASWRSLLPKATADAPKLYDQLQVLHIANTKLSSRAAGGDPAAQPGAPVPDALQPLCELALLTNPSDSL